jgi:hypothetical protein
MANTTLVLLDLPIVTDHVLVGWEIFLPHFEHVAIIQPPQQVKLIPNYLLLINKLEPS